MYAFSIIGMATLAATGLGSPVRKEKRETCATTGSYPWFIAPHEVANCNDSPPSFQPTSGTPPGTNATCSFLDPSTHASFESVGINMPCSDYPFTIDMFTTPDCSDPGVRVTTPICLNAVAGHPFVTYNATRA